MINSDIKRLPRQHGFTLPELAIVLVIIGLILSGILGSRTIIRSMQAKDVVAIAEDLRAASTYFKQRFNYLPGDFPVAVGDIPNIAGPAGNGNGLLDGAIDAAGRATIGTEIAEAPWQLFNVGFITKVDGSDPQRRVKSNFGGVHIASTAVVNGLVPGFTAANPLTRNGIVFFNLPCDVAAEVDIKVDDGGLATGRGRGTACTNDVVTWYAVPL